jgi:hypothetical protein
MIKYEKQVFINSFDILEAIENSAYLEDNVKWSYVCESLLELIKHEQEPIERRKGFNIIDGGNK